jgi:hypothetical protein
MVSYYLRRQVRDRMVIARALALSDDRDWHTIGNISEGLEVMFAVTGQNAETGKPEFLYISNSSWQLTGYWPSELVGQDPKVLQGDETNRNDAHRFMSDLIATGSAETKLVNVRKNGEAYGCHIIGCVSSRGAADGEKHYYAFFSECPIKECVSWNPAAIGGLQGNDQVKTS